MRTRNIQEELAEGFEPSPIPAPGPDGTIPIPPMRARALVAPRLCEIGPCRNYHRLESQAQAQAYQDGTEGLHIHVSHACYPSVGIEVELGDTPILRCNRWAPVDVRSADHAALVKVKAGAMGTYEGREFVRKLHEWDVARSNQNQALQAELDARDADADDVMNADLPLPDPDPSTLPEGDV